MITYKQKDNIFHIKLDGEVTYHQFVMLSDEISEVDDKKDILLLKYDLRTSKLNFTVNDYKKISNLALSTTEKYRLVKAAFVVTSPRLTAMLTIFSQLTPSNHTQRKVFSTNEAAISWLQLFTK